MGALISAVPFLSLVLVGTGSRGRSTPRPRSWGSGIGLAFSAMSNLVMQAVPSSQTGVATGMNANIRTIGGSIGGQIAASIIASGVGANQLPHEGGYRISFAFLGLAMVAAGFAAIAVPVRRGAHRRVTEADAVWREEAGPEPVTAGVLGPGSPQPVVAASRAGSRDAS